MHFESEIISETKFPKLSIPSFTMIDINTSNSLDTCDRINRIISNKEITFSFENIMYSTNLMEIEFDIIAKVNSPGLKFGKGKVVIDYTSEFGEFVVENNTIDVTKGTILEDDIYSISYVDISKHAITVNIDGGNGSNNMFTFTDKAESLLHVRMRISDFAQLGSISMDDIAIQGNVFYWCQGEYYLFNNINSSESITSVQPLMDEGIELSYYFGAQSTDVLQSKLDIELLFRSSSSSLLVNGGVLINYNDLAFGDNVIMNGNLKYIRSNYFTNSNHYTIEIEDFDYNTILLKLIANDKESSSSLLNLTESSLSLGKLVFNIQNCDEPVGLAFSKNSVGFKHIHFTNKYPIPFEDYSPVNMISETNKSSCGCLIPEIESFSPGIIPAGTGDILTIKGKHFGEWDVNNSIVRFNDGDGGVNDMMTSGIKDFEWDQIIHWADEEIQIKVPSTDRLNFKMAQPAASGEIQVGNSCGISDKSDAKLFIPYSIFNLRNSIFADPIKATVKTDISGGICFNINKDMPLWIRQSVDLALSEWCSETSVNFSIGGTTSNNNFEVDSENVISISPSTGSGLGASFNISASYYAVNSCTAGDEFGVMFEELDMNIVNGITNPTFDDELEMVKKIKHEFGHMHMLNHSRSGTTQFQYLMYTEGNSFGTITNEDSEGANLVFPNSVSIVHASCGYPLGNGFCGLGCTTNSLFEKESVSNTLEVYPNPTNGTVTVSTKNGSPGILLIKDINGRTHSSSEIEGVNEDVILNLPGGKGVYLIELQSSDSTLYSKVIKL